MVRVPQDSIFLECPFALSIVQAQGYRIIHIQSGLGLPLQDPPQRALRSQVEQLSKRELLCVVAEGNSLESDAAVIVDYQRLRLFIE